MNREILLSQGVSLADNNIHALKTTAPAIWDCHVGLRAKAVAEQAAEDFRRGRLSRGQVGLDWLLRLPRKQTRDLVKPVLEAQAEIQAFLYGEARP